MPIFGRSGAGGNRTPVHQPVDELATTIPGIATDAVTPTGRLSARGGPRSVFPECQQSFPLAAVFPAVIPHFCCRAVMDWPRATFLLTMTLRSLDVNQAARANCSSAILLVAPFSESEQLGSQTRTALLTSKPVSPVFDMCPHATRRSRGCVEVASAIAEHSNASASPRGRRCGQHASTPTRRPYVGRALFDRRLPVRD